MSVLGVGLDLVDVGSFARQLALVGSTFAESTFTPGELVAAAGVAAAATTGAAVAETSETTPEWARARHLAARFAAKEAFIKAWSMARVGRAPALPAVQWRELEVVADAWDRPVLHASGATAEALAATLGALDVNLSLTHDGPMAAAVVVLSVPLGAGAGAGPRVGSTAAAEPAVRP